jgi:hypothetical protein
MRTVVSTVALLLALALPAAAQQATDADIRRLQTQVYDAGDEIVRLRSRDSAEAARLQTELDELREEVIYLKVKLRKEGSLGRGEYAAARDRIEDLRLRASEAIAGDYRAPNNGNGSARARSRTAVEDVPVGTELDVRLQTPLSSDTAQVEDRFVATTAVDLMRGNEVLIPAGSVVRGVITAVDDAGRMDRQASITVAFDQITVRGRTYPIRATVAPFEGEGYGGDTAKIGTGAGVGAIIGGILGGWKGALAGVLIGAGGTIAATEGKDVELDAGTPLRVRFEEPLDLR